MEAKVPKRHLLAAGQTAKPAPVAAVKQAGSMNENRWVSRVPGMIQRASLLQASFLSAISPSGMCSFSFASTGGALVVQVEGVCRLKLTISSHVSFSNKSGRPIVTFTTQTWVQCISIGLV
jgi:hypothetical protein